MAKGVFSNPIERSRKISEAQKTGAFFPCEVCGASFWRKQYAIVRGENRFCTKPCYFKWQKGRPKVFKNIDRTGAKNPNWRGGIDPPNKRFRASDEYRAWRDAVFQRDDWTCQDCGERGVFLEAHHIKPFARYIELRTEVSNGLTLCKPCHNKIPKGNQYKQ